MNEYLQHINLQDTLTSYGSCKVEIRRMTRDLKYTGGIVEATADIISENGFHKSMILLFMIEGLLYGKGNIFVLCCQRIQS